MIFVIVSILLGFISFFDYTNISREAKTILAGLILLVFIIIGGFRYEFGSPGDDWFTYRYYFLITPSPSTILSNPSLLLNPYYYYGFGYNLFNVLLKIFTSDGQYFFVLCSIISTFLLIYNINTYIKKDRLIALAIYFGTEFLSLDIVYQRQIFAIQLFLVSIRFISEKRFLPFCLIIIIAGSMHESAFYLLPTYFFLNKKITNLQIFITVFLGLLFFIFNIDFITPIIGNFHLYRFDSYAGSDIYNFKRSFGVTHVELIIVISLIIYLRKKIELQNIKYSNIFINMYFVYTILILYFFSINSFSGRLKFYFNISYIFIFIYFIRCFKDKKKAIISHIVLTAYLLTSVIHLVYFYEFGHKGSVYQEYKNYLFIKN